MGLMNQKPRGEEKILMTGQYYPRINIASMHSLIHSYFLGAFHMPNSMMAGNSEIKEDSVLQKPQSRERRQVSKPMVII